MQGRPQAACLGLAELVGGAIFAFLNIQSSRFSFKALYVMGGMFPKVS